MRRLLLVATLAACHPGRPTPPPGPMACDADRIGAVVVSGASRAELAPLAVLEGTLDDPARTERIARVALEGLRATGHAKATLVVTRRVGCGVELHARVVRGPAFRIASIAFETDDEFPAAQRLAVLEDGLGTVNTVGGTYIAYRLQRALKQLKQRYADAGWVGAKVAAPRIAYAGEMIAVTIPITSGPRFTIGTIRAIGAGKEARATVLDALGLREGAYFDRGEVRAGIERAQRMLDRKIQLRVQVAPDRTEIDVDAIVEAP